MCMFYKVEIMQLKMRGKGRGKREVFLFFFVGDRLELKVHHSKLKKKKQSNML